MIQAGKSFLVPMHRQGGQQSSSRAAMHRLLVGIGLMACAATLPQPALAYSDGEIATVLKRRFSCPVLAPVHTQSGQVRGAAGPVQVFIYGAEGCPGLPFTGVSFAAAVPGTGGMGLLIATPAPTAVDSLAITDGYIVETSLDYAPSDPRCCPTRRVSRRWVVSGSRLVRTP